MQRLAHPRRGIPIAQQPGMKRVAPRTTRALAALAAMCLALAGVADGAHHCEMQGLLPCCLDMQVGVGADSCCSTAACDLEPSSPVVSPTPRATVPARIDVRFAGLPPFPSSDAAGAPAPGVERHPPPTVLRI